MIDTKLLRQKILDLAIRGKLVPQDPTDEPASELLKKIKAEKDALVKAGKIKKDKHESHIFKGDDNRYYETIDGKTSDITEEIPFDLPDGWEWSRMNAVASKITDGEHSTPQRQTDFSGYYLISARNILNSGMDLSKVDFVSQETFNLLSKRCYPKIGDILLSCSGTVGRCCICSKNNCVMVRSVALIAPIFILSPYIKYAIQSLVIQKQIQEKQKQVAQANIFQAEIKSLFLPVPPLAEQQRIVEQIETLLGYVDIVDTDAETLEKSITLAKQKILDLAIRGKLVPQDPADKPASELLKKIKAEKDALVKAGKLKKDKHESYIFKSDDNCYYEQLNGKTADITVDIPFNLPPKWCWCRLKNIIDLLSGRDLTPQNYNDKGGRYPYITGASNFDKSKLIINRWTDAPEVISIPNDVLLTCKGTIGEIAINSVGEIHIARQIMALRPSPSIIKEYLATVLQSMINHIKSEANGLIPGISRDVILELLIPIPPLAEQQRIVQAIAQYNSILELISK